LMPLFGAYLDFLTLSVIKNTGWYIY
ncbi:hypothetical protein, partial [Plasmodium yoelii yoelii]